MKSKIMMLAFVLALSGVAQAQYIVFEEDFEGLELGVSPEEAAGTPDVWTDTPPPGWFVDDSGIPGIGDPATDGMADWAGWAFADKDWWVSEAGNQNRSEFTLGRGTVAVADGDEWDDSSHPGGQYNAFMSTPAIDISRSKPGTLELKFASSWRPYDTQTGNITAEYDGGEAIEILRWESVSASANFKDYATNETAVVNLDNPAGAASLILTFGYFDAGNDWWWAIDNIMMTAALYPAPAYNANPPTGTDELTPKTVLSWTPGDYVGALSPKHKVILSDNLDAVQDGTAVVTTQDANSYDATGLLDFGTTYYWRIDEANSTRGWDEGSVWRFTTEAFSYPIDGASITATASSAFTGSEPQRTIDGSGLNDSDQHSTELGEMWLSASEPNGAWIEYQFGKVQKLHEMWVWNQNQTLESMIGYGFRDVTIEYSVDGNDYTPLGTTHEFAQAPGEPNYAHDTTVDFEGVAAKYVKLTANSNWNLQGWNTQFGLSEVRFFQIPVSATEPSPDSGTTGVDVDVALGWRAGREAVAHNVSFSDNEQAVIDGTAPVSTPAGASFSPADLDLNTSYYWKVAEVNEAETPSTWESYVWSFTTADNIIVDDFESYNNIDDLTDPASNRIFEGWPDGYDDSANGALIGNDPANPSYAETTIVHGGDQSIPFFYSNTLGATYSEAARTFDDAQDWTAHGVTTLGLWFRGTAGNTGQLYVTVNGSKVLYPGDPADLQLGWQAWNIPLTDFGGVNLQSVATLGIGIDDNGAGGTLYFDDIRLYSFSPQLITPVQPDNAVLIGHWALDGNVQDSSGLGNHGTENGAPTYAIGKIGQAMSFDGATYVAIDGVADDIMSNDSNDVTLATWVNMTSDTAWYPIISINTASLGNVGWLSVDNGNADFGDLTGTMFVTDNNWHHLAYTRIGDIGSLYVDGVLEGTHTVNFNFSADNLWSIGQEWDGGGPSDFFFGTVDDVRIYNYGLSYAEIAGLAGRTQPFDKPF